MHNARRTITALVIALLAAALPLAAQDEPRGTVSEEIGVNEVLLDVLVTDRRGNVILGLDKDDFVVEENGQPVEVRDVTFYSNRRFLEAAERAGELGIDTAVVPMDRYFILFFHDQRSLFPRLLAQQIEAGQRARRWVQTELLPNDYVAVVRYQYSLKLHQDFTNDAEALAAAIDEAAMGKDPKRPRAAGEGVPSLFNAISQEQARDAKRIYEGLQAVAEGAGAVRGRKNLILFSSGFGETDGFGFYRPDPRYFPETVQTLNDHNVAVYGIDLIPSTIDTALSPLASSLSYLASETGGDYFFNFVSFTTPLERISQQLNGYYMLSYTSRHPSAESGYQEVRVDTTNPEFRVRAREGYLYGS